MNRFTHIHTYTHTHTSTINKRQNIDDTQYLNKIFWIDKNEVHTNFIPHVVVVFCCCLLYYTLLFPINQRGFIAMYAALSNLCAK